MGRPVAGMSIGLKVRSSRTITPPTCATLPDALAVSHSIDWPGSGRDGAMTMGRSVVST